MDTENENERVRSESCYWYSSGHWTLESWGRRLWTLVMECVLFLVRGGARENQLHAGPWCTIRYQFSCLTRIDLDCSHMDAWWVQQNRWFTCNYVFIVQTSVMANPSQRLPTTDRVSLWGLLFFFTKTKRTNDIINLFLVLKMVV